MNYQKNIIVVILALVSLVSDVHTDRLTISSVIDKVTVYPYRARVHRSGTIFLDVGEHSLLFENLPTNADDASFRTSVYGPHGTMLLGISFQTEQHLNAPQQNIAELEQQIHDLEINRKQVLTDRMEVLEQRKKLLLAMVEVGGKEMAGKTSNGTIDIQSWTSAYRFFGSAFAEVADSMRLVRNEITDVDKHIRFLREKLQKITSSRSNRTKTVQVDVLIKEPGDITIGLEYMIPGASWRPLYNARLVGDTNVEIEYMAEITQKTGEEWKGVDMTLSTAMPSQGLDINELPPWYLTVLENSDNGRALYSAKVKGKQDKQDVFQDANQLTIEKESLLDTSINLFAQSVFASVHTGRLSTTFTVPRKESIPADGSVIRTTISRAKFAGVLYLICRPRLSDGVFRQITMTNLYETPFLHGQVNIFAESDFLGKTEFGSTIVPGQEFELPFGRDDNFEVKREIINHKKEYSGGIFSGSKKITIQETIKITLSNNGNKEHTIILEEMLPVSQDDRVKVKIKKISQEPDTIDENNKVQWRVISKPGKEQVIIMSYEIEYPENIRVLGL